MDLFRQLLTGFCIGFCITYTILSLLITCVANASDIPVTYEYNIKPIYDKRCMSCHINNITYDKAYDHRYKILLKFIDQYNIKEYNSPTKDEVKTIINWVQSGAKQ